MKLITSAIFALSASQATAAPEGSVDNANRKLQQTSDILAHILPSDFQDAKGKIFRHGCYCFSRPGGLVGPRNGYHGAPLDELDALCRDLFRAQKCLSADIDGCDADRAYPITTYNDGSVACGPDPNVYTKWHAKENNQCKLKTCNLEKEFAEQVKALFESGYNPEESISFIKDEDYDGHCPKNPTGIPPPALECCGVGTKRKPFNSVTEDCCNDQIVAPGNC